MTILLIPLGGIGERFKHAGYKLPKALIKVDNKEIIFHLLDNLTVDDTIKFVYIPYNKEYKDHMLEHKIKTRYPLIIFKFLLLENNTRGAADTICIALSNIYKETEDCSILCLDGDNFYTNNIIGLYDCQNTVFTFKDMLPDPIYSYIKNNYNDILSDIAEKEKISDNACCGAYGFKSWQQLLYYANYIIDNKLSEKNEYYISSVIKEMVKQNIKFKHINIQNKYYYSLGTPKQVNEYEYSFLFDLDGTLVDTDHIYTKVWDIIFKMYNFMVVVDKVFFNTFIKGKNDTLFLKYLLPNINTEQAMHISNLKDQIFIDLLKKNEGPILLDGVLDFFEINKNRKIAIVTSCNKKAAEYIINHTGLNNYISLLVSSDDCIRCKPDPEPYLKAISNLDLDKEKTIIFEDSYSGYTSAKHTKVYKIILVCNEFSCQDIINAPEYKIKDYRNFNIQELLNINHTSPSMDDACQQIKNELIKSRPIKDIIKNSHKLKTGYICDIQSYKIIFNDDSNKDIVIKINSYGAKR